MVQHGKIATAVLNLIKSVLWKRNTEHNRRQNEYAAPEQQCPDDLDRHWPVGKISENHHHPTEGEHRTKEQSYWRATKKLSTWTFFASLIAVALAGLSAYYTGSQSKAAWKAYAASDRAWLDFVPDFSSVPFQWIGIARDDAAMSVPIRITNYGHSPALDARALGHLIVVAPGADLPDVMRKQCKADEFTQPNRRAMITVANPHEENVLGEIATMEMDSALEMEAAAQAKQGRLFRFDPFLLICEVYHVVGDDDWHYTSRSFLLGQNLTKSDGIIDVKGLPWRVPLAPGDFYITEENGGDYAD